MTFNGLVFIGSAANTFNNPHDTNTDPVNVSGPGIGIGDNHIQDNEGLVISKPGTDFVSFQINGSAWRVRSPGSPTAAGSRCRDRRDRLRGRYWQIPANGSIVTINPTGTFDHIVVRFDMVGNDKIRIDNFNFTSTVTTNGGVFTIAVEDDLPKANVGNVTVGTVHEDGLLPGGNTEGGSQPVSINITTANLSALLAVGADEPASFSLNGAIDGVSAGVFSKGSAVSFDVVDADTTRGVSADNRTIFTIDDNGDGTFTFTLLDQLDHLPLNAPSGDADTLPLNLAALFTAEDFDGDTVVLSGTLAINVENDIPRATATPQIVVDEDNLGTGNNNTGSPGDAAEANKTGTLGFQVGADESATVGFTSMTGAVLDAGNGNAPVLSHGLALSYFWNAANNTLYGSTNVTDATTAANTAAFSVSVTPSTGSYTFTLLTADRPRAASDTVGVERK